MSLLDPLSTPPSPLVRTGVTSAIQKASARTGVDFSYLLHKAAAESSLNPTARAKTSTATGLFQFVDKTWLEMVREHGSKYGLQKYASCIDESCTVKNPTLKRQILDLRKNPELSALMAAEYARTNAKALENQVGDITDIGKTELYLAHFLGPNGAAKFLAARADQPSQTGAALFPHEAARNRGVFFDHSRARTLDEIYDRFAQKMDDTGTPSLSVKAMGIAQNDPLERSTFDVLGYPGQRPAPSLDRTAYGEWVDETPADLDAKTVEALLAAPATRAREGLRAAASGTMPESAMTALHPALMILAQTYAHEDSGRYNS